MPSSGTPIVYWDSCVFIDRIQRTPSRIGLLEEITDLAANGGLFVVTSALSIIEVLKGPDARQPDDEQAKAVNDYFENEWIVLRPVDRIIAERAADLRRKHRLKTADSVHVATALLNEVDEMHTYDEKDLLKLNGLVMGVAKLLPIIEPKHPEDNPLFDQQW